MAFEFDVFLSHGSTDRGTVLQLARGLEQCGLRVWLDDEQIPVGASIPVAIPADDSFIAAAARAVVRAGHVPVEMDSWTAADLPPVALDTDKLASREVYVGVLGFRYGSLVREDPSRSYTEHEFDVATGMRVPRLAFLLAENLQVPVPREVTHEPDHELSDRQDAFRARIDDSGLTRGVVGIPKDLETGLY